MRTGVLAVHDMKSAERCVKTSLAEFQYRSRREVYQLPIDMLKDIINKCNAIDGVKREYVRRRGLPVSTGGGNTMSFYAVFNNTLLLPHGV